MMHPFEGQALVLTALGEDWDATTHACPMYLAVESPWRPTGFMMSSMVLPEPGIIVVIGRSILRKAFGIDTDFSRAIFRRLSNSGVKRKMIPPFLVMQSCRRYEPIEKEHKQREYGCRNGELTA